MILLGLRTGFLSILLFAFNQNLSAQLYKISSFNLIDFSRSKEFIYSFYAQDNLFYMIGDNKKYILNNEGQLIGIDSLQTIEYKTRKIQLYNSSNDSKKNIYFQNDNKILVINNGEIANEITLGKGRSGRQIEEIEEDNNGNVYIIHRENIFDVLAPHLVYITTIDTKHNFLQKRCVLPFRDVWLGDEHRFEVADSTAIFNNSKYIKGQKEDSFQQELIVTNTKTFDTIKTINIDKQLKLKSRWEKTRIIWFDGKKCLFVTTCLENNGDKDVVGMANIEKGTITQIVEYQLPLKPKKDALNKRINTILGERASYHRYFVVPNGIYYSFDKGYLYAFHVTNGLATIDTYNLKDYQKN